MCCIKNISLMVLLLVLLAGQHAIGMSAILPQPSLERDNSSSVNSESPKDPNQEDSAWGQVRRGLDEGLELDVFGGIVQLGNRMDETDSCHASLCLGLMYLLGFGTQQSDTKAERLFNDCFSRLFNILTEDTVTLTFFTNSLDSHTLDVVRNDIISSINKVTVSIKSISDIDSQKTIKHALERFFPKELSEKKSEL